MQARGQVHTVATIWPGTMQGTAGGCDIPHASAIAVERDR